MKENPKDSAALLLYIFSDRSAKYWLGVLNEIKNRGVEDIMIVSVDGLTGFGDAIGSVFPKGKIQRYIVHQVRYSTKFVNYMYLGYSDHKVHPFRFFGAPVAQWELEYSIYFANARKDILLWKIHLSEHE